MVTRAPLSAVFLMFFLTLWNSFWQASRSISLIFARILCFSCQIEDASQPSRYTSCFRHAHKFSIGLKWGTFGGFASFENCWKRWKRWKTSSGKAFHAKLEIRKSVHCQNPPNVPHLRPIENLWACLKQEVYRDGWEASSIWAKQRSQTLHKNYKLDILEF